MAPELVRKHEYDGKHVDMWALGVMLYAMLNGVFPFRGQSEHELYLKIQRGNYRVSENISKEARAILTKLLETDSRKRLKASELLESPWIQCKDLPLSVFENAGGIFRASKLS